jgi:hypothetical protein
MESMPPKAHFTLASVILGGILVGCAATVPKEALELSPESLRLRQLQTRRFDSKDEKALLAAGAGVLQDLGFILDESEPELGVIVASKDRSAVEPGQVMASILMALLGAPMPIDKNQKIRASLVSRPVGEGEESTLVRVTFQRIVWNTERRITKTEPLDDPEFYQEFFSRLSKAVFLDAHEL